MRSKAKVAIGIAGALTTTVGLLLLGSQSTAGITTLTVDPDTGQYHQGDIFNVMVELDTTDFVKAWECKLNYNSQAIHAVQVYEGDLFNGYDTFFSDGIIDNEEGSIINLYNLILGPGNVSSGGSIVLIQFEAVGIGSSNLSLYNVGVTNETQYIPSEYFNSSVFVYSSYDINFDGSIDLFDVIDVAVHYGENGAPGWIPEDVNNDGEIDLIDLILVVFHWGEY